MIILWYPGLNYTDQRQTGLKEGNTCPGVRQDMAAAGVQETAAEDRAVRRAAKNRLTSSQKGQDVKKKSKVSK